MTWVVIVSDNGLSPFNAKPLPKPIITGYQSDSLEQMLVKFEWRHAMVASRGAFTNIVCEVYDILFWSCCASERIITKVICKKK